MPLRERGLKAYLFAKFWLPKINDPLAQFVSLVLIELLKCSVLPYESYKISEDSSL